MESDQSGLGGSDVVLVHGDGDPCLALVLTLSAERGPDDTEAEGSAVLASLVFVRPTSHRSQCS
jgi:hypothetical protein